MHNVLIVEDSLVFQRALQTRLQEYKDRFAVIPANNGEEAITILQKKQISLVVTDIQMPKLDGLALLAYLNESHPDLPRIAISGYATPDLEETLSRDGIPLFRKPFKMDELAEAILRLLTPNTPEGKILGVSVAALLQMIGMEEKSCLMEVTSRDGLQGLLFIQDGELHDAIVGELRGQDAAYALVAMDRVSMRLKNLPSGKLPRRIHSELTAVIMEGMRRKDEMFTSGFYRSLRSSKRGGM
jgi:CheY-like chemotaxis protein